MDDAEAPALAPEPTPRAAIEPDAPLEPPAPIGEPVRKKLKISPETLAASRMKPAQPTQAQLQERRKAVFAAYEPPDFIFPDKKRPKIAMDDAFSAGVNWAGNSLFNLAFSQGYTFLGYQVLAEMTLIPEYRLISEVLATEMTRKWIKIESAKDEADKKNGGKGGSQEKRIKELTEEMDRLDVRECFRKIAEQDGFYGRTHLYIDTGDTDDRPELMTPIGDGSINNKITRAKIKKGDIQALRVVEPVWAYPANYNANNPLKPTWYRPETWYAMATEIHSSRFLTFIGREVPDLLKPAFSFGGLSLTQMAKPYVDNWLVTRQSVSDIIQAFSQMILQTDLSTTLSGASQELFDRLDLFNNLRNNRGVMAIDKDTEDFKNVSAPLGSLDKLQAQAQEHMATPSRTPVLKLFGITPTGLNTSTDGEIRVWYDTVHAHQGKFFTPHLTTIFHLAQINKWGEIDPDLSFSYEKLYELTEKEQAEMRKVEAETAGVYIDKGITDPLEERRRLAAEPGSPYASLDVDDVPEIEEIEPGNIRETEKDEVQGE